MDTKAEMAAINAVVLSPEDEAAIDFALAHARDPEDEEVALSACFDPKHRMLFVELKTGQRLGIPQEDVQGISDANPEDLCEIEIVGPGTALDFVRVMEGFRVNDLRLGCYGSQRWMDGLAQRRRERLQKAS